MSSADVGMAVPRSTASGLFGRLHFVWTMFWATILIPPLGFFQISGYFINPTARNFKRWAGLWSRAIFALAGIRLRTHGSVGVPADQPVVLVCNHQSSLDIWANLAGIDHAFAFVAKESLRRVPLIGHVLRFSACLFVDRSTPRRAAQSIAEAADRIRTGNSVLIYPEGMRTWSPNTVDFMKGAYQLAVRAGVPLVPVAIMNAYETLDERSWRSKPGDVHMVIGEPIDTSDLRTSDIPELIETTRTWIQDSLNRFHAESAPPFKTEVRSVSSPGQKRGTIG